VGVVNKFVLLKFRWKRNSEEAVVQGGGSNRENHAGRGWIMEIGVGEIKI